MTSLPVVAIVGRPNVGKSTLFNRLVGLRKAIVHDQPGVTRDRMYAPAEWRGCAFMLGDTGGFEPDSRAGIAVLVAVQVRRAIEEAALILFVVDAREGVSAVDLDIARVLRRDARAPIFVVANKVDQPVQEPLVSDFFRLGFDEVLPVSAEHGLGVAELADRIVETLPAPVIEPGKTALRVAIVGRPNVGKSSLVNRILGEDRVIVSEEPGTTRDAIDTQFTYKDTNYLLIDTAGLRARSKIQRPLERFSVSRSLRAIERCDVALIILDASTGVVEQDAKIAAHVHDAGCGVILVVNKWDLMPGGEEPRQDLTLRIRERLRHLDYAPIAFISAVTGLQIDALFPLLTAVAQARSSRIPTPEINALIGEAVRMHPPPSHGRRPIRFQYATQAAGAPPTFVLFVSDPRGVPVAYRRYLVGQLRRAYTFVGTPIRLILKQKRA